MGVCPNTAILLAETVSPLRISVKTTIFPNGLNILGHIFSFHALFEVKGKRKTFNLVCGTYMSNAKVTALSLVNMNVFLRLFVAFLTSYIPIFQSRLF